MTKEILKNYEIDENGNVYSKISKKTLKQYEDRYGYLYVTLNGKKQKIHRLVAMAFIPNIYNKKIVDHIDTNRKNNNVNNLRWVTAKENANNELTIIHLKEAGIRYRNEYGKRIIDGNGNKYISIIEASRQTGIKRPTLQNYLKYNKKGWKYE